jgi:hypothetical protein
MKIKRSPKQTPEGGVQNSSPAGCRPSAPGGLESMVWEELAPRLLHPTKLAFIRALLESGEPLSAWDLAEAAEITKGHADYHCKRMLMAGVLVETVGPRAGGEKERPLYFFPEPADSRAS